VGCGQSPATPCSSGSLGWCANFFHHEKALERPRCGDTESIRVIAIPRQEKIRPMRRPARSAARDRASANVSLTHEVQSHGRKCRPERGRRPCRPPGRSAQRFAQSRASSDRVRHPRTGRSGWPARYVPAQLTGPLLCEVQSSHGNQRRVNVFAMVYLEEKLLTAAGRRNGWLPRQSNLFPFDRPRADARGGHGEFQDVAKRTETFWPSETRLAAAGALLPIVVCVAAWFLAFGEPGEFMELMVGAACGLAVGVVYLIGLLSVRRWRRRDQY
jgi:hypothetical protein